jgi:hypothetical protein
LRIFNNNSQLVRSLVQRVDQLEGNAPDPALPLNLQAETWTDFAEDTEVSWQILGNNGSDLTDSFEYRRYQGKWQLYSLTPQANLQIIL